MTVKTLCPLFPRHDQTNPTLVLMRLIPRIVPISQNVAKMWVLDPYQGGGRWAHGRKVT